MGESHIDELSKALARENTRRGALKLLATTVAGGALALAGAGTASARLCRDLGQACRSNADCCSRFCPSDTFVCSCPGGFQACQGNCVPTCPGQTVLNPTTCQCECPSGTTLCGNNTCCGPGQICFQGTCRAACPQGTTPCGSAQCCSQGQACVNGLCGFFCPNGTFCQQPPFNHCFCIFNSCTCTT